MSPDLVLQKLLSTNPRESIPAVEEWLKRPQLLEVNDYEIVGRGFPPVALTVGGPASAAGAIIIASVFGERLRFVVTSPQVAGAQQGPLSISRRVVEVLEQLLGLERVIIPFDILTGSHADRIRKILRQGSLVVNGVSVELALWLGRNAGFGRLLVYRPVDARPVFRFL